MKVSTFALASVSMLAMSSAAFAQTAPAPQESVQEQKTQQAQPGATVANTTEAKPGAPASAAQQAQSAGDIVVTATRRAERLQDVPIAVSAITGDKLQKNGFQSLTDIQYQFSGVQFGESPNDAGFRLRGVGTAGGFSSSSEQNVGTVVDNVVVPFGSPVNSLGDLDRVEVLKGPQGTQFGKNSSSGVVNITTRKPDLNNIGGSIFGSYASLNESDVHGAINVPIIPGQMAVSVFAFHRQYDGFVKNITLNKEWGGDESYGVRAKLLWKPNDTFSAYLIGDWSRDNQQGPGQLWTLNRLPSFSDPLMAARFAPVLAMGVVPGLDNTVSVEDTDAHVDNRNYGASLEMNLALGGDYNLTSITAYRRFDEKPTMFGIDALPLPIFVANDRRTDQDFLSQEIRLTSPKGSPFEYIAGVYLSQLRTGIGGIATNGTSAILRPALPFDPVQISITNGYTFTSTNSKSIAGFVDGRLKVAGPFSLIGGLRVQHDKVTAESFSEIDPAFPPGVGPNGFTVPYAPRPLSTGETSKTDWSGRFGGEYKPSRDVLFFATVARGYLGPTVTFSGLTGTQVQVKPQTVRDITIGAKTQLFDRRLTLNADVFYDKYKDLQTSVFNGLEFLTENAGGFTAKGIEVDSVLRITRRFSLNGSITYSKTRFTDYITACPNFIVAQGAAAVAAQCNAPGSVPGTPLYQAAGNPLNGAPRFSATAGFDFYQPLTPNLQLDASANFYHRSRVFYDVGNPWSSQPGYSTVGGTIGIGAPGGKWRAAVFVRNLFDKHFVAAVIGLPFSDPGGEVNWLTREGRRTVGVSGEFRF
jgi:iron complex outermembrane receptor protein